jgi:hypothetical protein
MTNIATQVIRKGHKSMEIHGNGRNRREYIKNINLFSWACKVDMDVFFKAKNEKTQRNTVYFLKGPH